MIKVNTIKHNTREDRKALFKMLTVMATLFAIIYLIGSTGAYENDLIDTPTYIIRIIVCVLLVVF